MTLTFDKSDNGNDILQLTLDVEKLKIDTTQINHRCAVCIQKYWRGYWARKTNLPLILQFVRSYLLSSKTMLTQSFEDGRSNSCFDELAIIQNIQSKYPSRIEVPPSRMWYDILLLDRVFGWIPVNIKTTTMKTNDNTGNLAMCVYAYTDYLIDLRKSYTSGVLHEHLVEKLKKKQLNTSFTRDYYFLVLNKTNADDIVINSVRGLRSLTNNVNNLPFQVKWMDNRNYVAKPIAKSVEQFILCIKKNKASWKEKFVANMKLLE